MSDIAYRFTNQLDEERTRRQRDLLSWTSTENDNGRAILTSDADIYTAHKFLHYFFSFIFFVMVFKDYLLCVRITCYVFCLIDITTRKTCKICFWLNKQELNILMSKLWIMENLVLNQQRWNWYTYQIYNSLSDWSSINYIWLDIWVQKPKIKKQPELQTYWLLIGTHKES